MSERLAEFFRGFVSLLKGLAVTFRAMFLKPVTVQYPEQRVRLPLRFRGRLVLPIDEETGTHRCTACRRCMKACPNRSIVEIEKAAGPGGKPTAARYVVDLGRCMFCNLCIEACPFCALVMSDECELSTRDKSSLQRELVAERYRLSGGKADWWRNRFREPAAEG